MREATATKGALGLKHVEEKTSKSGMLAVVWAKKLQRRSRAETKEQNAFKQLQKQNFEPSARRRRRLFEYQLQEARAAADMPPDLYGSKDITKSLGFAQSWLPAARMHHAHFAKKAAGDIQVMFLQWRSLRASSCMRVRMIALCQSDDEDWE